MENMTDIMVDLETSHTDPELGGIIQLSAIKFNLETLQTGDIFDRCPSLLPKRTWSEGTKQFWQRDRRDHWLKIVEREEPYGPVYEDFIRWVSADAPYGGYNFWAKPIKFDWPFVESQLSQLGYDMPFPHYKVMDLHSYIAGLRGSTQRVDVESEVEFKGIPHNALHDAAYQIDLLFHAKRHHVGAEIVR